MNTHSSHFKFLIGQDWESPEELQLLRLAFFQYAPHSSDPPLEDKNMVHNQENLELRNHEYALLQPGGWSLPRPSEWKSTMKHLHKKKNCFETVTGCPALIGLWVQIQITFSSSAKWHEFNLLPVGACSPPVVLAFGGSVASGSMCLVLS